MNYLHAFHAGNFADIVKHAAVLRLLDRMTGASGPLTVIDTHAGRGVYDLGGVEARRSGEAQAGVIRLMQTAAAPAAFGPLMAAVRELNPKGGLATYPGSPWLIAARLRPGDTYIACELREDEHAALGVALKARSGVETLCADGFATAVTRCPAKGSALVVIDPPFEKPDDYRRIVETVADVLQRNARTVFAIWLPLKDLETFDAFLRDLEDAQPSPILVAETRMHPLADPMKMNGCAMVFVNAPKGLADDLTDICRWPAVAQNEGGDGRVRTL